MEFPDAYTAIYVLPSHCSPGDSDHAHIVVGNTFGCPMALKKRSAFSRRRYSARAVEKSGSDRDQSGGLYAYRWASENPGEGIGHLWRCAGAGRSNNWLGGTEAKAKGKQCRQAPVAEVLRLQRRGRAARVIGGNPIDILETTRPKPRIPLIRS